MAVMSQIASAAEDPAGEKIYREKCAICHGAAGEGTTDEYPHSLSGDKPVAELANLIDKSMPKDAPEDCVGEDAEKVAAYLYDAFYSPIAQARIKPARIELSRLTVRQYRHALADLVGGFRPVGQLDEQRGLRGEYFNSRGIRNDKRLIDRLDPEVKFDFGTAGPDPEKFEANQFSIRWQGALLAPDTGEYELIVRTDHAARLWLNDLKRPFIDAGVKSGSDTEYRDSVWLLGGRAYPLRLEFTKGKQGVDDSKNQKKPPPAIAASISLEWKRPRRVVEVIPSRHLSPGQLPESYVASTPFPPDDRSIGYERGTSISKAWDQATTDGAIEAADYVASHLKEFTGTRQESSLDQAKAREFCKRFAERAFRRPLSDEQSQFFIERQFQSAPDPETAAKRVMLLVLKSPRFLYREAGGGAADPFDAAARLSFGLWDSLPDDQLLKAAAAGELATREHVAAQAERMARDPRATAKLREFFLQWLKIEQVPDLAKDVELFSDFNPALASNLRSSLELFLDEVLASEGADFRQLLLADYVYLNGPLARFYGVELPADAPFQKMALDPAERSGVLTHPYLMADFAYTSSSSPIHRGVFIARSLLGRALRPPPEAVTPLAPDLHPDLTTRERVSLQTKHEACQRCHVMINHLGFPLEHFDAVGRYRKEERGRPIDATGAYQARSGEMRKFSGARDLGQFLAASEETHSVLVEKLFHHLVKQPIRAYDAKTLPELRQTFTQRDFNLRRLMVEIMVQSALHAPAAKPE